MMIKIGNFITCELFKDAVLIGYLRGIEYNGDYYIGKIDAEDGSYVATIEGVEYNIIVKNGEVVNG